MDDRTFQLLTELAHKLGTTAEHLWEVLLRQAMIAGICDIAVLAAWAYAIIVWMRVLRRKTTAPPKTEAEPWPRAEWDADAKAAGYVSIVALWIIFALITGLSASTIAAELFNPEYWALDEVLTFAAGIKR